MKPLKEMKGIKLIIFDFDHTLIDVEGDAHFVKYFSPKLYNNTIRNDGTGGKGWIPIMSSLIESITKELCQNDHDDDYRNQLRECLSQCKFPENCRRILKKISKGDDYKVYIVSDSNVFFIEEILKIYDVINNENKNNNNITIISNPCDFDENNVLRLKPLMKNHGCKFGCNDNICKGKILKDWIILGQMKDVNIEKVCVVGDGKNDFCQCTVLKKNRDFVFYRKDYKLEKRLVGNEGKINVVCRCEGWNSYDELEKLFEAFIY